MRLGDGKTNKGQKKKTKQLFSFLYELIENILKLTFVTWGVRSLKLQLTTNSLFRNKTTCKPLVLNLIYSFKKDKKRKTISFTISRKYIHLKLFLNIEKIMKLAFKKSIFFKRFLNKMNFMYVCIENSLFCGTT